MMRAAAERLEELKRIMMFPFNSGTFPAWIPSTRPYKVFIEFVKDIAYILRQCSRELVTLDSSSQNLPGWFLTVFLNQSEVDPDTNFACSDCYPAHPRSIARRLESSQDACSQFLLSQHHFVRHSNAENQQQKHADLSLKVAKRASATFKSFGSNKTAEYAEEIGVYHPDEMFRRLPGLTEGVKDCLGRSELHFRMDDQKDSELEGMLISNHDILKLKDKQDILGRTVLLMACQDEWDECVEILLEQQADPGLATMYGSLPLHYAAAMGSIDICTKLLAHKTRFDIKAKDYMAMTALDWAMEMGCHEVVELLSAEYASVDNANEEQRKESSFESEVEHDEMQESYSGSF
jgi:hypothetical protein